MSRITKRRRLTVPISADRNTHSRIAACARHLNHEITLLENRMQLLLFWNRASGLAWLGPDLASWHPVLAAFAKAAREGISFRPLQRNGSARDTRSLQRLGSSIKRQGTTPWLLANMSPNVAPAA